MKNALLFGWLLVPVAAGAYHFGPGQEHLRADRAAACVARAEAAACEARETVARDGDDAARYLWAEAEEAYAEAIDKLPSDRVAESRALRLERAKAGMFVSKLREVRGDLEVLVDELVEDPEADETLLADAREALANSQYYSTWLLRLEGAPRETWEPEVEASRQNYRLLAERAAGSGDVGVAAKQRQNLESAIRLARMDLSELQGLPLPSQ